MYRKACLLHHVNRDHWCWASAPEENAVLILGISDSVGQLGSFSKWRKSMRTGGRGGLGLGGQWDGRGLLRHTLCSTLGWEIQHWTSEIYSGKITGTGSNCPIVGFGIYSGKGTNVPFSQGDSSSCNGTHRIQQ